MSGTNGLPNGWATGGVGELLNLVNGRAFKPTDWKQTGLPIIRIQNLNDPEAPFNYYPGDLPTKFLVESGDLLFAWSGTPGTSFGAHIWRGGRAWLNQHIFKVLFDRQNLDVRFLRLAINQNLTEYIMAAHGGAGLAHITKGRFESSTLRIPPRSEQHRIVAKIEELFSDLDAGVAGLQRVRASLKRYRAAVVKAAVDGRLTEQWRQEHPPAETADKLLKRILLERRQKWEQDQLAKYSAAEKTPPKNWRGKYQEPTPADAASATDLPPGWCWSSIDQLSWFLTDGEHVTPPRTDEGIYLLSARNVLNGKLSLDDVDFISPSVHESLSRRLLASEGDVLLSCSGTVGRSCTVPKGIAFSLVRSVAILKPILGMGPYVSLALRSPLLQYQITQRKSQTAQANIFQSSIKKLSLPVPPPAEQNEIVREVEKRLSVADAVEAEILTDERRSARLRQSILRRAFDGTLVPQDLTDEPASRLLERIKEKRSNREMNQRKSPARKGKPIHSPQLFAE